MTNSNYVLNKRWIQKAERMPGLFPCGFLKVSNLSLLQSTLLKSIKCYPVMLCLQENPTK